MGGGVHGWRQWRKAMKRGGWNHIGKIYIASATTSSASPSTIANLAPATPSMAKDYLLYLDLLDIHNHKYA